MIHNRLYKIMKPKSVFISQTYQMKMFGSALFLRRLRLLGRAYITDSECVKENWNFGVCFLNSMSLLRCDIINIHKRI